MGAAKRQKREESRGRMHTLAVPQAGKTKTREDSQDHTRLAHPSDGNPPRVQNVQDTRNASELPELFPITFLAITRRQPSLQHFMNWHCVYLGVSRLPIMTLITEERRRPLRRTPPSPTRVYCAMTISRTFPPIILSRMIIG